MANQYNARDWANGAQGNIAKKNGVPGVDNRSKIDRSKWALPAFGYTPAHQMRPLPSTTNSPITNRRQGPFETPITPGITQGSLGLRGPATPGLDNTSARAMFSDWQSNLQSQQEATQRAAVNEYAQQMYNARQLGIGNAETAAGFSMGEQDRAVESARARFSSPYGYTEPNAPNVVSRGGVSNYVGRPSAPGLRPEQIQMQQMELARQAMMAQNNLSPEQIQAIAGSSNIVGQLNGAGGAGADAVMRERFAQRSSGKMPVGDAEQRKARREQLRQEMFKRRAIRDGYYEPGREDYSALYTKPSVTPQAQGVADQLLASGLDTAPSASRDAVSKELDRQMLPGGLTGDTPRARAEQAMRDRRAEKRAAEQPLRDERMARYNQRLLNDQAAKQEAAMSRLYGAAAAGNPAALRMLDTMSAERTNLAREAFANKRMADELAAKREMNKQNIDSQRELGELQTNARKEMSQNEIEARSRDLKFSTTAQQEMQRQRLESEKAQEQSRRKAALDLAELQNKLAIQKEKELAGVLTEKEKLEMKVLEQQVDTKIKDMKTEEAKKDAGVSPDDWAKEGVDYNTMVLSYAKDRGISPEEAKMAMITEGILPPQSTPAMDSAEGLSSIGNLNSYEGARAAAGVYASNANVQHSPYHPNLPFGRDSSATYPDDFSEKEMSEGEAGTLGKMLGRSGADPAKYKDFAETALSRIERGVHDDTDIMVATVYGRLAGMDPATIKERMARGKVKGAAYGVAEMMPSVPFSLPIGGLSGNIGFGLPAVGAAARAYRDVQRTLNK